MSEKKIRVLVVDDSAFARKVLRETLSRDSRFDVVGVARDGLEALERIAELAPDVMTLDLVMPNLDGIGLLKALPAVGAPRVVVVSMAGEDSALGLDALAAGAIDIVHKPTALATDRLYELGAELVAKVAAAASATPYAKAETVAAVAKIASVATSKHIVLIGASTGGPQALTKLLAQLPADFPVPIAIVLHMPVGYTSSFAQRLNEGCALEVKEASEGLVIERGMVVIARAGMHLRLARERGRFVAHLDAKSADTPHMPAVDVLFGSLGNAPAADVLAVVLTGMGDDGVAGGRLLVAQGGAILTESESSCVVYGMPRAIVEAGLSAAHAPLSRMLELISRHL